MLNILKLCRSNCMACSACTSVCPTGSITMYKDIEGFDYPYINPDTCIMCGQCRQVCEKLTPCFNDRRQSEWYAFSASSAVRWEQPGGGFVPLLISYVHDLGGSCFFPVLTESGSEFAFIEVCVDDNVEFCAVRYLEAQNKEETFNKIKVRLDGGKMVLFIGNPCEVIGLKRYLGQETEKLILVETICNGVASQKIWNCYLSEVFENDAVFRIKLSSKEMGCAETIQVYDEKTGKKFKETASGNWIKPYHDGVFLRKSCYDCEFAEGSKVCDFTLGVLKEGVKYNDGGGASLVGVNSDKGRSIFDEITENESVLANAVDEAFVDALKLSLIAGENKGRRDFFVLNEGFGYKKALFKVTNKPEMTYLPRQYALDYHSEDKQQWIILNSAVWEKRTISGNRYLFTDGTSKWQRVFFKLNFCLIKDQRYRFNVKVKLKSEVRKDIRLMLSNKPAQDAVCPVVYDLSSVQSEKWNILNFDYIPRMDNLMYLMLVSTDFLGIDSYISFEWIRVWEE